MDKSKDVAVIEKIPSNRLPFIDNYGLWDVYNIEVEFLSDRCARFYIRYLVINGGSICEEVNFTLLDRIRGISFGDKVGVRLASFKAKYHKRNEEILRLREMGSKYS